MDYIAMTKTNRLVDSTAAKIGEGDVDGTGYWAKNSYIIELAMMEMDNTNPNLGIMD